MRAAAEYLAGAVLAVAIGIAIGVVAAEWAVEDTQVVMQGGAP